MRESSAQASFESAERALRQQVSRCSPHAITVDKELIRSVQSLDRLAMIKHVAKRFADCLLHEEGREGIAAFAESRKPRWFMS